MNEHVHWPGHFSHLYSPEFPAQETIPPNIQIGLPTSISNIQVCSEDHLPGDSRLCQGHININHSNLFIMIHKMLLEGFTPNHYNAYL